MMAKKAVERSAPPAAADERPPPSLSLAELVIYLEGDADLADRVLRMLRLPAHDPQRPVRVRLDRLERLLHRLEQV